MVALLRALPSLSQVHLSGVAKSTVTATVAAAEAMGRRLGWFWA
jgi:hypothetical protein